MEKKLKSNSIVYLSIGSNLGNRLTNIQNSIDLIRLRLGKVFEISSVYENPPVGFESDSFFYNLCISVQTNLKPIEVLNATQQIELELGRTVKTSEIGYASRIIDIDLIFFDDLIIDELRLKIPHPLYTQRRFVLIPLSEIASNVIDPVTLKPINEVLESCLDESKLLLVEASIS